jgi:hypothetical protein
MGLQHSDFITPPLLWHSKKKHMKYYLYDKNNTIISKNNTQNMAVCWKGKPQAN